MPPQKPKFITLLSTRCAIWHSLGRHWSLGQTICRCCWYWGRRYWPLPASASSYYILIRDVRVYHFSHPTHTRSLPVWLPLVGIICLWLFTFFWSCCTRFLEHWPSPCHCIAKKIYLFLLFRSFVACIIITYAYRLINLVGLIHKLRPQPRPCYRLTLHTRHSQGPSTFFIQVYAYVHGD